jgi:hypothetical protein
VTNKFIHPHKTVREYCRFSSLCILSLTKEISSLLTLPSESVSQTISRKETGTTNKILTQVNRNLQAELDITFKQTGTEATTKIDTKLQTRKKKRC